MLRRILALAVVTVMATAANVSPPPAVLAPSIVDGHVDPGDYGWMRGDFAGATPAQQAASRDIRSWLTRCHADQAAAVRAELARRGVVAQADDRRLGNDGLCGEVAMAGLVGDQGSDWAAFAAAVARAAPPAQAVIWGAALAQAEADAGSSAESAELIARPVTDQILRVATFWGEGEGKGAPRLDPRSREIARAMLWGAIARRDHANTAWLKALVARGGWPTIAKVGSRASEQAWLLVQHADDDPVFQLDMLRLMEPLAAKREVSVRNYAMLYDRVMLTLTGKQRYASQAICVGGRWAPRPLEDAAAVDHLRAEAGMTSLAGYLAGMDRNFPCPPDAVPPSPAKR